MSVCGKMETLSCDEIVHILTNEYASSAPSSGFPRIATLRSGSKIMFSPLAALKSLNKHWNGEHGPSEESKDAFSRLSWAESWIKSNEKNRSKLSKVRCVSKSVKIQLLQIFYPTNPPYWKDEIPVSLEDGTTWTFKPVEWMDDISNNWLEGRAAVLLSDEEKKQMEKMEWLGSWIERVSCKREARKKRKANTEQM